MLRALHAAIKQVLTNLKSVLLIFCR